LVRGNPTALEALSDSGRRAAAAEKIRDDIALIL